jgi:hypothetical protein
VLLSAPATLHGILALAIGVALAGLALSAVTYPRVMFARFPRQAGGGGLDIAPSGPDRERFEEFLRLVQRQIRKQKKA